jgi:antitoxin ParD1/3/4
MTFTIDVPPEMEAQLRIAAAQGDGDTIRRLLAEATTPIVEALLRQPPPALTDAEFEALADQLADEFEAAAGGNVPVLSDYALTCEGIYEDHPKP